MNSFATKLVVAISIGLILVASPASAEMGAYQAGMRNAFLSSLRDRNGDGPISVEAAEKAADCYAAFAIRGFTPEELRALDAFIEGGPQPDPSLVSRALKQLSTPAAEAVCEAPRSQ
jgi:hypothetical protein